MKKGIIGFITGIFNGLFGSGGGTIVVPCMEKFLGFKTHKAHASAIAVILPLSVISAFIYVNSVDLVFRDILFICLGGIAGGFLGAKLLNKISTKWLHRIFGLFMIAASVRMIL